MQISLYLIYKDNASFAYLNVTFQEHFIYLPLLPLLAIALEQMLPLPMCCVAVEHLKWT